MLTFMEQLNQTRILPVIEIDDAENAAGLGQALLEGGLPFAEITLRTPAALAVIEKMAAAFPDLWVGAGSVLDAPQAQRALEAGARFIVSPGFSEEVLDWCLARAVAVFPGVATPTEVMYAMRKGLKVLKFFPAEALGGVNAVKAVAAPFPGMKFIPTGGISAANLADYLRLAAVTACGGSWLASRKMIAAQKFDEIARLTREALQVVEMVRKESV